jgi:exodeoxyribonuclease V alpha subunit
VGRAKAGFAFHELQRTAVRNALTSKLSVLTGGPGTGKTTILRALVEILKAKKVRVHLAAPTGRAAQRLAETTGGFASTIHRLLRYDAARAASSPTKTRPLATDFLVVDEASMLDTRLAAALLQAVPSRAHLLLVGDTDQLPSVGAGNVLKDLIATGTVPVTRLSVIYRQQGQSQIVTTAHAINAGDPRLPPVVPEVAAAQVWSDLTFVAPTDAEDCVRKVIQLCTEFMPALAQVAASRSTTCRCSPPCTRASPASANLNAQLQAALNPAPRACARPAANTAPATRSSSCGTTTTKTSSTATSAPSPGSTARPARSTRISTAHATPSTAANSATSPSPTPSASTSHRAANTPSSSCRCSRRTS